MHDQLFSPQSYNMHVPQSTREPGRYGEYSVFLFLSFKYVSGVSEKMSAFMFVKFIFEARCSCFDLTQTYLSIQNMFLT